MFLIDLTNRRCACKILHTHFSFFQHFNALRKFVLDKSTYTIMFIRKYNSSNNIRFSAFFVEVKTYCFDDKTYTSIQKMKNMDDSAKCIPTFIYLGHPSLVNINGIFFILLALSW